MIAVDYLNTSPSQSHTRKQREIILKPSYVFDDFLEIWKNAAFCSWTEWMLGDLLCVVSCGASHKSKYADAKASLCTLFY